MDIVSTMEKVAGCFRNRSEPGKVRARRDVPANMALRRDGRKAKKERAEGRARRGTGRLDGVRAPGEAMPEAK